MYDVSVNNRIGLVPLTYMIKLPFQPAVAPPMSVAMCDFSRFLATEFGESLLASETAALDDYLPGLVGYNLLQLSVQKAKALSSAARVGQYIQLGFAPNLDDDCGDNIWADYQSFPIANDCIDIALLHHVLDFSADPHQLLREADRTLTAGGHMVVLGFNPLSSWPLYQRYAKWGKGLPMPSQAIRRGRLTDWLSVLNYDVVHQQCYFYRPPINSLSILNRLELLEKVGQHCRLPFGIFYLVVAKKRTFPVNFIRNYWPRAMKPARLTRSHSHNHVHSKKYPPCQPDSLSGGFESLF